MLRFTLMKHSAAPAAYIRACSRRSRRRLSQAKDLLFTKPQFRTILGAPSSRSLIALGWEISNLRQPLRVLLPKLRHHECGALAPDRFPTRAARASNATPPAPALQAQTPSMRVHHVGFPIHDKTRCPLPLPSKAREKAASSHHPTLRCCGTVTPWPRPPHPPHPHSKRPPSTRPTAPSKPKWSTSADGTCQWSTRVPAVASSLNTSPSGPPSASSTSATWAKFNSAGPALLPPFSTSP